jgi:hypothetical protein
MYEDGIANGSSDNFELIEEITPYPSLNKLNDHLIFSIFRREKTRHNLKESIESMVRTFIDLCSDFHDSADYYMSRKNQNTDYCYYYCYYCYYCYYSCYCC